MPGTAAGSSASTSTGTTASGGIDAAGRLRGLARADRPGERLRVPRPHRLVRRDHHRRRTAPTTSPRQAIEFIAGRRAVLLHRDADAAALAVGARVGPGRRVVRLPLAGRSTRSTSATSRRGSRRLQPLTDADIEQIVTDVTRGAPGAVGGRRHGRPDHRRHRIPTCSTTRSSSSRATTASTSASTGAVARRTKSGPYEVGLHVPLARPRPGLRRRGRDHGAEHGLPGHQRDDRVDLGECRGRAAAPGGRLAGRHRRCPRASTHLAILLHAIGQGFETPTGDGITTGPGPLAGIPQALPLPVERPKHPTVRSRTRRTTSTTTPTSTPTGRTTSPAAASATASSRSSMRCSRQSPPDGPDPRGAASGARGHGRRAALGVAELDWLAPCGADDAVTVRRPGDRRQSGSPGPLEGDQSDGARSESVYPTHSWPPGHAGRKGAASLQRQCRPACRQVICIAVGRADGPGVSCSADPHLCRSPAHLGRRCPPACGMRPDLTPSSSQPIDTYGASPRSGRRSRGTWSANWVVWDRQHCIVRYARQELAGVRPLVREVPHIAHEGGHEERRQDDGNGRPPAPHDRIGGDGHRSGRSSAPKTWI